MQSERSWLLKRFLEDMRAVLERVAHQRGLERLLAQDSVTAQDLDSAERRLTRGQVGVLLRAQLGPHNYGAARNVVAHKYLLKIQRLPAGVTCQELLLEGQAERALHLQVKDIFNEVEAFLVRSVLANALLCLPRFSLVCRLQNACKWQYQRACGRWQCSGIPAS